MRLRYIRNSQGVALLAALFVLMVLSILGIGLLTNVDDEIRMSKSAENSEMALKIAEAGIQVGRSTFVNPAVSQVTQTEEFSSIDGFYRGGYFLVQMKSGFQGAEKWVQWRYDEGVTGHNPVSEISAPVFHVWRTGAPGINGSWGGISWQDYSINPIYGIVARGTYFPIESISGNTEIRAHDEYTGDEKVIRDTDDFTEAIYYWRNDKALTTTFDGLTVGYAVNMNPMVSFSNYSSKTGEIEPVLDQQTLYFVYSGNDTNLSGSIDRSSTVRLRAANALCNGGANASHTGDGAPLKSLWEFDTRMHGIGSAPAFFDPTPHAPGDEILYFAVISRGETGSPGAFDLQASAGQESMAHPSVVTQDPEQIYLFAIIDTTGKPADCSAASLGSYKVKWAHPFPDPDVVNWTDYPTEHVTGTDGTDPPYASRPDDMTPFLPEEDLLVDYRDGPGTSGGRIVVQAEHGKSSISANDGQWNHVRGNILESGMESGVSPPVVKVLYRDSSGNLTERRSDATDPYNPIIDIYLMYSAMTRVTYLRPAAGSWIQQWYWNDVRGDHGVGWGPPGYRKPNTAQVRVLALRDQLVRSGSTWNWNAAKSRFPTFKWTDPVPPWDPDQTYASPDTRPGNGYGEYTWDTWFPGQIAPMINVLEHDQDLTPWTNVGGSGAKLGGTENLYTVIYPYYKSAGFLHLGAEDNSHGTGRTGPSISQGAPRNFNDTTDNSNVWTDSRVMLMAIRDTWDDYMRGNQTNPLFSSMAATANPSRSNPVEPYWTHKDGEGVGGAVGIPAEEQSLITYNASLNAPYRANASKVGFPRPYVWWEKLWEANIREAPVDSENDCSLYQQGWENVITNTALSVRDVSLDVDVEGETAAMCPECLQTQGLLVLPFNYDLSASSDGSTIPDNDGSDDYDREDLRIHGINTTTGLHVWDYHMPASFRGDDANNTPAIANSLVFVAYQKYGDKANQNNRRTLMTILDADEGIARQKNFVVDQYSDAVILPPTIANGAVYVGTYSFEGTYGSSAKNNDYIRLFAMSPVIRLVSTGVYPFDYPGAEYPYGYKHYTGGAYPFAKITSLDHDAIFKNPTGEVRGIWKRKLQVWVTGQNSKWEEVREVLEE
jgi:hypothetical protein